MILSPPKNALIHINVFIKKSRFNTYSFSLDDWNALNSRI
jgi:hypothetical protein